MKTYKIHFVINWYEDTVIIKGETLEDIKSQAIEFFEARGTTAEECNAWSEQIK